MRGTSQEETPLQTEKSVFSITSVKKIFLLLWSGMRALGRKRFVLPFEGRLALALKAFSPAEKRTFWGAAWILFATAFIILAMVNRAFMVEVPAYGGSFTEGVLGTPAHINPLLASGEIGSDADRDLVMLIYSGLLRADGEGGMIFDLADRYEISDDGLVYTFKLKKNLTWHDGEKLTARDVVFTVKTAQDSRIKSSKRASWDGVSVEQIDELTVRFTLKKPYAPFLENMTMGILPEHIWETIDFNRFDINNYNRRPIGSGPYRLDEIQTIRKDGDEIPVSYTLKAFKDFALGSPYIKAITIIFYRDEESMIEALRAGDIEAVSSLSSQRAKHLALGGYEVQHTPLPRVLAVFFNQNQAPIFADESVRKALNLATDKKSIIEDMLSGYGIPLDSPIPPGSIGYRPADQELPREERLSLASSTLKKAGWNFSTTTGWTKKDKRDTLVLKFDLATSEASELKAVAQHLQATWKEIGVDINVRTFSTGDLKETIVRPRKFDALFFGQILGRDGDPYPFWHSSQRLDPGLNIASYVNARVDKILDNARMEKDLGKRIEAYQAFHKEVLRDTPAIFLYAPEFLYVTPKKIKGISLVPVTIPSERFLHIYEWYIHTNNVWKVFAS